MSKRKLVPHELRPVNTAQSKIESNRLGQELKKLERNKNISISQLSASQAQVQKSLRKMVTEAQKSSLHVVTSSETDPVMPSQLNVNTGASRLRVPESMTGTSGSGGTTSRYSVHHTDPDVLAAASTKSFHGQIISGQAQKQRKLTSRSNLMSQHSMIISSTATLTSAGSPRSTIDMNTALRSVPEIGTNITGVQFDEEELTRGDAENEGDIGLKVQTTESVSSTKENEVVEGQEETREPGTEPTAELMAMSSAEPGDQLRAESGAETGIGPEAQSGIEPGAESGAEPETKPEDELEAEPGVIPDAESGAKHEDEEGAELQIEMGVKPEAAPEAEPGAEPSGAEPEVESTPEQGADPSGAEPETESDAEQGAEPSRSRPEAELGAEQGAEPSRVKSEAESSAEQGAEPSEAIPEAESGAEQGDDPSGTKPEAESGAEQGAELSGAEPETESGAGQEAESSAAEQLALDGGKSTSVSSVPPSLENASSPASMGTASRPVSPTAAVGANESDMRGQSAEAGAATDSRVKSGNAMVPLAPTTSRLRDVRPAGSRVSRSAVNSGVARRVPSIPIKLPDTITEEVFCRAVDRAFATKCFKHTKFVTDLELHDFVLKYLLVEQQNDNFRRANEFSEHLKTATGSTDN